MPPSTCTLSCRQTGHMECSYCSRRAHMVCEIRHAQHMERIAKAPTLACGGNQSAGIQNQHQSCCEHCRAAHLVHQTPMGLAGAACELWSQNPPSQQPEGRPLVEAVIMLRLGHAAFVATVACVVIAPALLHPAWTPAVRVPLLRSCWEAADPAVELVWRCKVLLPPWTPHLVVLGRVAS